MKQINIEKIPFYKIKITGDIELIQDIEEFLTSTQDILYKNEKNELVKRTDIVKLYIEYEYDEDTQLIITDQGYFYFILMHLYKLKQKYPTYFNYSTDIDIKGKLKITEKWYKILRKEQLEAFKNLTKLKGCLIQLPTSWGKTELFIAIIESYLEQFLGNILITVPRNPIQDEIIGRLKKYNISNKRIDIINPVGYNRSLMIENIKYDEWLSNVGLVIHDEVHHVLANSYRQLLDKLSNLEYVYGLSATISSKDLTKYDHFKLWDYETQLRIGMCGPCIVHKFAKDYNKMIKYYRIEGNFGKPCNSENEDIQYFKEVENICFDIKFKSMLKVIITKYGYFLDNRIFYIPVPFKEAGYELWNFLQNENIPSIHWCGGYHCNPPEYNSLEKIKQVIETEKCKVLIATSTSNEGIDISGLTAAILAFGRSEHIVPQVTGRAGRQSTPLIFNILNKEHNLFKSQALERDKHLKYNYGCKVTILKF